MSTTENKQEITLEIRPKTIENKEKNKMGKKLCFLFFSLIIITALVILILYQKHTINSAPGLLYLIPLEKIKETDKN